MYGHTRTSQLTQACPNKNIKTVTRVGIAAQEKGRDDHIKQYTTPLQGSFSVKKEDEPPTYLTLTLTLHIFFVIL